MQGNQSEVARLLQQITQEYEAATLGLTGLAYGTSQHAFITARMENMSCLREELATHVGEMTATRLVCQHCFGEDVANLPVKGSNEAAEEKTKP